MPSFVRSDFRIALAVRTADGEIHDAGSYTSESRIAPWGEGAPLSHLHRVSPDGRWLASLDVDHGQIQLRDLSDAPSSEPVGSMATPRRVALTGLAGDVRQVRWLDRGGMTVATSQNLYVVPLAAGDPTSTAGAVPVFDTAHHGDILSIADTRIVPGGVLAQVVQPRPDEPGFQSTNLYLVRTDDPRAPKAERVEVGGRTVRGASVRSDGRFVVHVWDEEVEPGGATPAQALWTFATRPGATPTLVEQRPCADPDWCDIANWSPGSQRLVYATTPHEVVVELPHGRDEAAAQRVLPLMDEDEYGDAIHGLWMSSAEDRVVAANDGRVRMWDGAGELLWSWDAPKHDIHSVHFTADEQGVLVAAGREILRIDDGQPTTVASIRRPRIPYRKPAKESDDFVLKWEHDAFIDGVTPLPGGAVAYMVVRLSRRDATWAETEPVLEELHGPLDPVEHEVLTDPFAGS